MAQSGDKRKLATILAIDMAGYSAQSERNQERAISYVAALRERAAALAATDGGHIFNTAGDGLMLEFPIASGAVRTAVTLAREAVADPQVLPRIRAGAHLGEVIVDGSDRLGHGVNVAARLMQMAPPNGVVISDAVKSQLRGEIDAGFDPRGRVRLKKMREVILAFEHIPNASVARRLWRRWRMPVLSASTAAALVALTLVGASLLSAPSETPFVAVMPFDNLSGDPNLAYFSDGVSTEIQATLAQYQQGLRVAGLATGFRFHGADKDPARVRQAMGATHVVDGSVRREGSQVRIVAELTDARSGAVIWTQTYDRALSNTLEVEAVIARQVGHMLHAAAPDIAAPPEHIDPTALEHYLNAVNELDGGNSGPGVDRAVEELNAATSAAPRFARAWALHSSALSRQARIRGEEEQAALMGRARDSARKALSLDPHLALAEAMLGRTEPEWNWEARKQHYQRAVALAPNDVTVLGYWGDFLWRTGHERENAQVVQQILRLDPLSRRTRLQAAQLMVSAGDLSGATREAERLTEQHEYGAEAVWWAILGDRENAGDVVGMQGPLRELERLGSNPTVLAEIRQDLHMFASGQLASEAQRAAYFGHGAQIDYARFVRHGVGQECAAETLEMMVGNYRTDLAWTIIENLYIRKSYIGSSDTCYQFVYPQREANTGFLFQGANGENNRDMEERVLRNPRIWRTFDAVGLTRYWRAINVWPDFCSDTHLTYDCRTMAAQRRS